jgi:hypothetical protein
MKMAPLLQALHAYPNVHPTLIHTGPLPLGVESTADPLLGRRLANGAVDGRARDLHPN